MAGWYVRRNEKVIGPIAVDQLKQFAADGRLLRTDKLAKDLAGPWTEAGKTKLFAAASSSAPAVPTRAAVVEPTNAKSSETASAPSPIAGAGKAGMSAIGRGMKVAGTALSKYLSTRAQRRHELKLAKVQAKSAAAMGRKQSAPQDSYSPPPSSSTAPRAGTTTIKVILQNRGGCGCSGCVSLALLLILLSVVFAIYNRSDPDGAISEPTPRASTPEAPQSVEENREEGTDHGEMSSTSTPLASETELPQAQAAHTQEAIPDDVTYEIINDEPYLDIKRSVDVRLNRRVSTDVLEAIAYDIKGSDAKNYDRTYILYYLPGMEVDAGAWASTHFNPELEVKVLGSTEAEQKRLTSEAKEAAPRGMIGRWIASDKTAFPGVITIVKTGSSYYKLWKFADGSEERYALTVELVSGEVRYKEKDRGTSDYVVVLPNGDLGHGDDDGIWTTSRKAR